MIIARHLMQPVRLVAEYVTESDTLSSAVRKMREAAASETEEASKVLVSALPVRWDDRVKGLVTKDQLVGAVRQHRDLKRERVRDLGLIAVDVDEELTDEKLERLVASETAVVAVLEHDLPVGLISPDRVAATLHEKADHTVTTPVRSDAHMTRGQRWHRALFGESARWTVVLGRGLLLGSAALLAVAILALLVTWAVRGTPAPLVAALVGPVLGVAVVVVLKAFAAHRR